MMRSGYKVELRKNIRRQGFRVESSPSHTPDRLTKSNLCSQRASPEASSPSAAEIEVRLSHSPLLRSLLGALG